LTDLKSSTLLIELKGVGETRSRALAQAGFVTVADLLFHLPFRYEDRRQQSTLATISEPGRYSTRGRLSGLKRVRVRRRNLSLVRGWIEDGTGRLPVIWFNRPYLINQVQEEAEYALYGEVRWREAGPEMINPTCERIGEQSSEQGIVPVYPAVAGLGGSFVRRLVRQVIASLDPLTLADPLPPYLRERRSLPSLGEALTVLHRPGQDAELTTLEEGGSRAHARLAYGEFLELQVELGFLRGYETRQEKDHRYRLDPGLRQVLVDILPFRLTGAQRRVLKEISTDLSAPFPMLRLLQGDVGSGKTIVAVMALVMALESGLQGAFMAPTELLAEQHFQTLFSLLKERYRVALLTSSVTDPRRVRTDLADGTVQLVVGTHALIQEDVEFARLGLAVVDEQHRFGVAQRRYLQRKGKQPDLLVMTATPIPRSLAMTVYGDLSLSVIDELPPGRLPVETSVVPARKRRNLYEWLRQELADGSQAYVVFPLIEDSDQLIAESIATMGEELRRRLGGIESAILHGRIPVDERDEIMARFRQGDIRVLVATTVIEVGVDVPNASIMLIESGERFGLSQLHQLRGRVGRGRRQSTCVVVHGSLTADARRRLEVFSETNDGFRIAEADLQIRGPGDLLGTRQSGVPLFRVADIIRDREWLERARLDAEELIRGGAPGDHRQFLGRLRRRARSRYERFAGG